MLAAFAGHSEVVQLLIESGSDVSDALFPAAESGVKAVVRKILDVSQADLENKSRKGATPLLIAAAEGHVDVFRLLLQRGASISATTEDGYTCLHQAAKGGEVDIVKDILKDAAGRLLLNTKGGPSKNTALACAAATNNASVVGVLLDAGADPNIPDKDSNSALYEGCLAGDSETVQVLLASSKTRTFALQYEIASPLMVAASRGCYEIVKMLLDAAADIDDRDQHGRTALHHAALKGRGEAVRYLLRRGADAEIVDRLGAMALHMAARIGSAEIVGDLLSRENPQRHTSAANATDGSDSTPLLLASSHGHAPVVKLLLSFGANPDSINESGSSPLHEACREGHLEVVLELLKWQANPELTSGDYETPLISAVKGSHLKCVETLLEAGANPNNHAISQPSALEVACRGLSVERNIDELETSPTRSNELSFCDNSETRNIISLLLRHGADPESKLEDGTTLVDFVRVIGDQQLESMLLEAIRNPPQPASKKPLEESADRPDVLNWMQSQSYPDGKTSV